MSDGTSSPADNGHVSAEAVQAQLQRILMNELFKSSPQHQLLLRTIVNESITGHTDKLKEVVLGTQVLNIADYDSSQNTQVRVVVSLLRKKLKQYYLQAGPADLIAIDIPLGHYVAKFSARGLPQQELPARAVRRHPKYIAALAVLSSVIIALILLIELATRKFAADHGARAPVQLTFDGGSTEQPAISQDGSVLAYASDRGASGRLAIWIQKSGGPPRQLTDGPAQDFTPDISPDGSQVVFRSWREPAGIWVVSASGGAPRLLVKDGYSPRFSPDGSKVAYIKTGVDDEEHVFVSDLKAETAQRLDFGVVEAGCPVWFPDGRTLVFQARDAHDGSFDYWTAPAFNPSSKDKEAHPLGINAALVKQDFPPMTSNAHCPQDWDGDHLLGVTYRYLTPVAFKIRIDGHNKIGPLEPLSVTIGGDSFRISRSGERGKVLVFSTHIAQTNIWTLDRKSNLTQVTHDNSLMPGFTGTWPALSTDSRKLAYITERFGKPDICLRDLDKGSETLLGAAPFKQSPLFLDANGDRILFEKGEDEKRTIVIRNTRTGTETRASSTCPVIQDWHSRLNLLLCSKGPDLFLQAVGQPASRQLYHLSTTAIQARLSPDAQWVSYTLATGSKGMMQGFISSVNGPSQTFEIYKELYNLSLHWANDGNSLYYWTTKDGSRCLYSQSLDPRTKRPLGPPAALLHRHASQHYPWGGATLSVSSSLIAFSLKDELSNLWKIDLSN